MTNPSRRDDGGLVTDIHRMYCTHCTFGTSVLEKRTTENAAKILGYSVRAASVADRDKIRRVFRSIERLLSYDLPKGTPSTEKVSYNAAKAPRRCPPVSSTLGSAMRMVTAMPASRTANTRASDAHSF